MSVFIPTFLPEIDLVDKLVKHTLDEEEVFPIELNEIFRLPVNNPVRKIKERTLLNEFNADEDYKDFYKYVLETSPEEYEFDKEIVKKREVEFYRNIIESVLKRSDMEIEGNRSPINTPEYLVEQYVLSNRYRAIKKEGNDYTEEDIKEILDGINTFLASTPVGGIKHLSPLIERYRFQIFEDNGHFIAAKVLSGMKVLSTDRQIAARIALGYIGELSDEQLIDLASTLGVISDEQRKIFTDRPYKVYSGKRTGKGGYENEIQRETALDYQEGSSSTREEK